MNGNYLVIDKSLAQIINGGKLIVNPLLTPANALNLQAHSCLSIKFNALEILFSAFLYSVGPSYHSKVGGLY